jgi:RNA recognition motif-containing protein
MNRLFVGNIPFNQSEEALCEWFVSKGFRARSVEIIQDRLTNKPRGFGFVELEEESLAELAVRSLNGERFGGRILTISWATPVRQSA